VVCISKGQVGRRTLPPKRIGSEKGREDGTVLDGPKEKCKPDIDAVKAKQVVRRKAA
jgi:hypothetical protein